MQEIFIQPISNILVRIEDATAEEMERGNQVAILFPDGARRLMSRAALNATYIADRRKGEQRKAERRVAERRRQPSTGA